MLTLEMQIVVNFGRCDQKIYALTYQNIQVYPQVYREYLNDGIKDTNEMMSSIKTYFNGGYSYGFRVAKGGSRRLFLDYQYNKKIFQLFKQAFKLETELLSSIMNQ